MELDNNSQEMLNLQFFIIYLYLSISFLTFLYLEIGNTPGNTGVLFWTFFIMRSIPNNFYKSKSWKVCRESYIKSKSGLCERCLKRGLIVPGKIVHHTIYLKDENYEDPEISLNPEYLELLCRDCHNKEHFKADKVSRYSFNESGELMIQE